MHIATGKEPIVRISRLTGQPMTYHPFYNLQTFAPTAPPESPDALITYINDDLTNNGQDAFVDQIKFFREPFFLTAETRMYIAEPAGKLSISATIAIAVCTFIIAALVAYTIWEIKTTAKFVIETFYPQLKFHQVDVNGNSVTLATLTEYVTCQRTAHPEAFVCQYCGQVFTDTAHGGTFATIQEAQTAGAEHQTNCPWIGGPPGQPDPWTGMLTLILIAGVSVVGLWALVKVLGRK